MRICSDFLEREEGMATYCGLTSR